MPRSAINLRHFAALVVLRTSDSLDESAQALSLTRSALSRQLADLEQEFGAAVYERHRSPIRLTPLGVHLADVGQAIQKLISRATEKSKELARDTTDRQYLSATRSAVPSVIPRCVSDLPAIFEQRPSVAAATVEFFTNRLGNEKTRVAYARALSELADWCDKAGIQFIDDLKPEHIQEWIAQLAQRLATSSVRVYSAAVRTLFHSFVRDGILPANPASFLNPTTGWKR